MADWYEGREGEDKNKESNEDDDDDDDDTADNHLNDSANDDFCLPFWYAKLTCPAGPGMKTTCGKVATLIASPLMTLGLFGFFVEQS